MSSKFSDADQQTMLTNMITLAVNASEEGNTAKAEELLRLFDNAWQKLPASQQAKQMDVVNLFSYASYLIAEKKSQIPGIGSGKSADGGQEGPQGSQGQVTFDCKEATALAKRLPQLTFDCIAGMQREKNEFRESFFWPLLYPNLFPQSQAILLWGPPGTGKSYIASAVAAEARTALPISIPVLFYALTGADLKAAYVGQTGRNIVAAYTCVDDEAKKGAISIMFLDEMEVIGGKRSGKDSNMSDAVTALLVMMSGPRAKKNLKMIGATNRPWDLDSAVLSRFPRKIFVDTPGDRARYELLVRGVSDQLERDRRRRVSHVYTLLDDFEAGGAGANPDLISKIRAAVETLLAKDDNLSKVLQALAAKNYAEAFRYVRHRLQCESPSDIPDSLAKILSQVAAVTGMSQQGFDLLVSQVYNGNKSQAERFLKRAGKVPMKQTYQPFGYSNRDLSNLILQALATAATEKLKQGGKDGCMYDAAFCDSDGKQECRLCSDEDRAKIFLKPGDIKLEHFTSILEGMPSSAQPREYIQMIRYLEYQEDEDSGGKTPEQKKLEKAPQSAKRTSAEALLDVLVQAQGDIDKQLRILTKAPKDDVFNPTVVQYFASQALISGKSFEVIDKLPADWQQLYGAEVEKMVDTIQREGEQEVSKANKKNKR